MANKKISASEFSRLVRTANRPASEVGKELTDRGFEIDGIDQYKISEPKKTTYDQKISGGGFFSGMAQRLKAPEGGGIGSAGQTLTGNGLMENLRGTPDAFARAGQSALPMAGSIVGGMAGLPAAPATFGLSVVGGAAAGRAIGEVGAQQIGAMRGEGQGIGEAAGSALSGDSEQFQKQAGAVGKQALIGGAEGTADLLFMGAGKAIGKLAKPFKGQVDDVAAKLFQKYKITPPVSAISKSEAVKQGEAIASKGMTGKSVQEVIENATQRVTNIGDDLVKKIGGSDDVMIAGKEILEGAKKYEQSWRGTKNALYSQADDLISSRASTLPKGEFINVDATKTALDNILSSKKEAKKVLGEMVDLSKLGNIRKNLDTKVSIKALSSALDEINKLTPFGSEVATGDIAALKSVAATLSKDLDNHIRIVQPEIGQALDAADEFYSEGIGLLNSQIGNTIRRLADSPEKIAEAVVRNASPSDTKRLIQLISSTEGGAQRLADVQTATLKGLIDSAKNDGGVIMGKTFSNKINKMGKTLDELFTPEIAEGIRETAKMALSLDKGQAAAKGSQTAFLAKLGLFWTSLLSSPINPAGLPTAISIAAQDVGFSKIFSTDFGRKLLTKGFEVSAPESVKMAGRAAIRGIGEQFSPNSSNTR